MYLDTEQVGTIERQIASVEARSGVQVLVALIGRCDAYPEIRWKAFALGVAIAALAIVGADLVLPAWSPGVVHATVAILAAASANALLAHFAPGYGRRFVRGNRAEAQTRDYARGLFLERALFATPARTTVLIVAGLFERVVVVHPDAGFEGKVAQAQWQRVVDAMSPLLAKGERQAAIEAGLLALDELLRSVSLPAPGAGNALPDRPIQERGA